MNRWIRDHPYWSSTVTLLLGMFISPLLIIGGHWIQYNWQQTEQNGSVRRVDSADAFRCDPEMKPGFDVFLDKGDSLTKAERSMRRQHRTSDVVREAICHSNEKVEGVRLILATPRTPVTDSEAPSITASLILHGVDRSDTMTIQNSLKLTTLLVNNLKKDHLKVANKDGKVLYDRTLDEGSQSDTESYLND